ncbi:hypothetical protein A2U01_0077455, partial [Trifolium medium]|nr:hypothetical protein [Trifolium medium]
MNSSKSSFTPSAFWTRGR